MSSQFYLSSLLVATVALAISVIRPTLRDIGLIVASSIFSINVSRIISNGGFALLTTSRREKNACDGDDEDTIIQTIHQLRQTLPAGLSGSNFKEAKKVTDYLDEQMIGFINQSPFLQLATVDVNGSPFVSPKGDKAGFVTVQECSKIRGRGVALMIPDRPGNRLIFGLQNIVTNPKVSILFEIPGTHTTLRCGGNARISKDLRLLEKHTARGCTPKVVLVVEIEYAFFHCAKAYMRSGLWNPESWPTEEYKVGFGQYFAPKNSILANRIDNDVDVHYSKIQNAIDGNGEESER